uniref:Uncharacterized protein n=1 Tax=viral metagenome TaxID=1070528 RepID=A0A6C0FDW1_9ZZZZ|tara:strand:+ start:6993 stop:7397 length:405 start_codon:yes stop_codon:yes gene_type:complete
MNYQKIVKSNCSICNIKTDSLPNNKTVYCSKCMRNICTLTHIPDNFDRCYSCNYINEPIIRDGHVMCVGHYKKLQMHCKICGEPRKPFEKLSYDHWYYCHKHIPSSDEQSKIVYRYLIEFINKDCISHILSFLP